ncbi:hypothetical protein NQ314_013766 [Rhamnusium bicolor]|uniref:Uncharacterized protein n=1 Tax=Rhamnusium bicolor TaxID=1586634 RepID=A0AAV8X557_9CUCU|nr:hypothetical protein NQ314_013766 [Rhamnusium bicolor]
MEETSPFHYSPPKSPTQQGGPSCDGPCGAGGSSLLGEAAAWASSGMTPARPGRQTSPFSFSPQKSAPSAQRQETRLEEVSTTVHQKKATTKVYTR